MNDDHAEKTWAVLGLARAGIPAARFLAGRGARVVGYDSRVLADLSDDARALENDGVILKTGDHDYEGLDDCDALVLSPGLKIHHEPLARVLAEAEKRGAEIIGELELAARNCAAPIIAVTGTKGKSTTVKLIEEMLRACGENALRCGNTGTPLIAELPKLDAKSWAIVEVSSFQLERAPTFSPRVAVLLNLLRDHLDYHPSLMQYWNTKLKMFANLKAGDSAVFNADDESFARIQSGEIGDGITEKLQSRGVEILKSSSRVLAHEDAATRRDFGVCRKHGALGFRDGDEFFKVVEIEEIALRGEHNLSNVAAALAAVVRVLGSEKARDNIEKIAGAIRDFESLPHRLEIVAQIGGVTYVNDSQATIPEAAMRAMKTFPAPLALICGGRAKLENADAFDELGVAVAHNAQLLLLIGEAAERIADAARRGGMSEEKIVVAKTLDNAVKIAHEKTPRGGSVVMSPACASFDQFMSFEARGQAFRDAVEKLATDEH